jgi:hypothetical protein
MPVAMTTSSKSKSKSKRTELSSQSLPKSMTAWDEVALLKWIQKEKPGFLIPEYLNKFAAARISGETFLRRAGDVDFFLKAGLPLGASEVLANLGDKVMKGKFIPRT